MDVRRLRNERGSALLEVGITLSMLLLIGVGIFEFGHAYRTWQVLTNAAREAARVAILPNTETSAPEARARAEMDSGGLPNSGSAVVIVDRNATMQVNGTNTSASEVTIDYPFDFVVLQPVAWMIDPSATLDTPVTLRASTLMRNEAP